MVPSPPTFEGFNRLGVISVCAEGGTPFLGEERLEAISQAFYEAVHSPAVDLICLMGTPDRFLLGADVPLFLKCLAARDWDRLLAFTRSGQRLLAEISASPKPVVAWVQGPAVGAGLELALACHRIVAGPGAKFSLPETGLGIYPGLGGTQRLPRRIGLPGAKWMIYSGAIVPAPQALEMGLIDALQNEDSAGQVPNRAIVDQALSQPRRAPAVPDKLRFIYELLTHYPLSALTDAGFPLPNEGHAARALVQMRGKAPLAMRLVEQIMDQGFPLDLPAGLEIELAHLAEIFASEDARIGLTSIGKSRPVFVGR